MNIFFPIAHFYLFFIFITSNKRIGSRNVEIQNIRKHLQYKIFDAIQTWERRAAWRGNTTKHQNKRKIKININEYYKSSLLRRLKNMSDWL